MRRRRGQRFTPSNSLSDLLTFDDYPIMWFDSYAWTKRLAFVCLLQTMLGLSYAAPVVAVKQDSCQTPPVGLPPNDTRQSCSFGPICISAPSGAVLVARTLKRDAVLDPPAHASEHACDVILSDYVEIVPGTDLAEPTRACLTGWVKSVGGSFNYDKRVKLTCTLSVEQGSIPP